MFAPCRKHAGGSVLLKRPVSASVPHPQALVSRERRRKPQLGPSCCALYWSQAECWGAQASPGTSSPSFLKPGAIAAQEVPAAPPSRSLAPSDLSSQHRRGKEGASDPKPHGESALWQPVMGVRALLQERTPVTFPCSQSYWHHLLNNASCY